VETHTVLAIAQAVDSIQSTRGGVPEERSGYCW